MTGAAAAWAVHRGHLLMLLAWPAAFGAVLLSRQVRAAAQEVDRTRTRYARRACAAGAAAAAGIHLAVVPEHLREAGLYGAFFLALAAAQLAYAGAVLARPSRALLVAGAVASALVVALWLQTRLVGVPLGPGAGEREPFGLLDLLCAAAETATAGAALAAARVRLSAPARP